MSSSLAIMLLSALLSLSPTARAAGTQVRGQIDWQGHPAMHMPWPMFSRGLRDRDPFMTWRHQFRQTVHAPYLERSGVRIFLTAAMAAERARNPDQARRLILRQLRYVEEFVQAHPDRYAMARTPAQARELLTTTDKMVLVHSIEGGRRLLTRPGDATFWADQGVALVTLIHLYDDELGGAALNPGLQGRLVNPAAARKRRQGQDRGLTPRGREAMVELGQAGVLVDLSHMSPQAAAQALELTAAHGMPPVVTHGFLASITRVERAFTDAQVVEIYRQGGSFNLGLNGVALDPVDPSLPIPPELCPGTLDSFQFHHQTVQRLLLAHAAAILGEPGLDPSRMTEDQRTALATGWSSDWNGWTSHSRPKHGPGRCLPLPDSPLELDVVGLAHPGLLPQHWQRLAEQGTDLDPMQRSAEQFLRLWERARGEDAGGPDQSSSTTSSW